MAWVGMGLGWDGIENDGKGQAELNRDGKGCDNNGQDWAGPGRAGQARQSHPGTGREEQGLAKPFGDGRDGQGLARPFRDGKGGGGPGKAIQGWKGGAGPGLTSVGSVAALAQKRLLRAMPLWSAVPAACGEEVSERGTRGPGGTGRLTRGAVGRAAGHPLQRRLQGLAERGAGGGARGGLCADLGGDGVVGMVVGAP